MWSAYCQIVLSSTQCKSAAKAVKKLDNYQCIMPLSVSTQNCKRHHWSYICFWLNKGCKFWSGEVLLKQRSLYFLVFSVPLRTSYSHIRPISVPCPCTSSLSLLLDRCKCLLVAGLPSQSACYGPSLRVTLSSISPQDKHKPEGSQFSVIFSLFF